MDVKNFKQLGITAYEYFWEQIDKKNLLDLTENIFLRGSILVPESTKEPYRFKNKLVSPEYWTQITALKDLETIEISTRNGDHNQVVLRDRLSQKTQGIILVCYEGTGFLLWIAERIPTKKSKWWKPVDQFPKLKQIRKQWDGTIRMESSDKWHVGIEEAEFLPKLDKSVISRINASKKEVYIILNDFYACLLLEENSRNAIEEVDKAFSHFGYSLFVPDSLLLLAQDDYFKISYKN